ncbi:hypothetical protein HIM_06904 [Hirsutella minnesotensis 3608]|uniref:Mannosyltransferase n=1 Tax=Hirsutella minnesotensis 3608 TaxID=1043627 RepID=A0A0F7ZIJ8_9HYPO|nr:hypothetical protein HIM_06904 [Hirsutella minnesotensis 3608]
MRGGRGHGTLIGLRLVFSAWLCIWLRLVPLPGDYAVSATAADKPPRAVLVSLAHEHDLDPILSSVSQLEKTFNNRHRYDWVFFSTRPLGEEFRRLTSNATNATCMYEVIHGAGLTSPKGIREPLLRASQTETLEQERNVDTGFEDSPAEATSLLGQVRRWKSGIFAKESRLKGYDWFWIIEPGAQFTHNIDFDVFRAMRDVGIAYGSNRAVLDMADVRKLSPHVKTFINDNPELVHADADISWLLEPANKGEGVLDDLDDEVWGQVTATDIGDPDFGVSPGSETRGWLSGGGDVDDVSSAMEAFASRLSGIFTSSLWPAFEIGSLAFLRSQNHQALFEHLDKAGDLYYGGLREASTPTISASMFLPQKSVLHFRKRDRRYAKWPSPPESTPDPNLDLGIIRDTSGWTLAAGSASSRSHVLRPVPLTAVMRLWFTLWDDIVQDFERQDRLPGLRSGNTVIDERNFVLIEWKKRIKLPVKA